MSHRFETGMVGRSPAWHGLGTVVDSAKSAADAILIAGLDWSVAPQAVTLAETGQVIPGWQANVRDKDGRIVGLVRDTYKIHQPRGAFDFLDQMLDMGAEFDTAGSLCEGSVIWVSALLPPQKIIGSEVAPYLFFTTSYDYSIPSMVAMTPTQIVCWNTLNYAIGGAKRTWTLRHTSTLEGRVQEAQATLGIAGDFMGRFKEDAEQLHKIILGRAGMENIVNALFPMEDSMTERRRENVRFFRDQLWECIQQPDLDNYNVFAQATGWTAMQAVADLTSHLKPLRHVAGFEERRMMDVLAGPALLQKTRLLISNS